MNICDVLLQKYTYTYIKGRAYLQYNHQRLCNLRDMDLVGRNRLAKQLKRLKLVNEQPFVERQDLKYSNEGINTGLYLTLEIRLVMLD